MKIAQIYSRNEVKERVGAGGDDYIFTKNKKVHAITLNPEMNPKAQEIVIIRKGPRVQNRAHC